MASINTIVKRKQYLWLGIVVVGAASAIGGVLYLSDVDMSGNGEAVAEQEPVPDMTGVVDTTFDDKVRQHATTEMQVTAAQMQKQYEEIRRELDVLNKQRGDDQRRIEKLGQDNAALAEQVKALGANPVTATGEPVPQMPASPPGHSVSDSATVFASVTQMAMDNATLNGLARSGRDVRLYSSLDETRTAEKLARHPSFTVVSEQIKARAGETSLETAISLQKTGLHTPAQQAIHLALPVLESKNLAFSMVDLLTEAKSFAAEGTGFTELGGEINAQIKRGDLLYVDVAKGYGTGLLVSRASYEAEKSILRHTRR